MHFIDEIRARRPNRPIVHYTSLDAFLEIVRTKTIWASKIQYLNDEQDFRYAGEIIRQYIEGIKSTLDPAERGFVELMSQRLSGLWNVNVYVASFSEQDDLLSQWRGYCPPGKGINIGFTAEDLEIPLGRQPFSLMPCIYDGREQARIVRELVGQFLGEFRQNPSLGGEHLMGRFALFFTTVAPVLKHEKFTEEAEWRLVSNVLDINHFGISQHVGYSTIVPHFNFRLALDGEELRLGPIRIGPTPHVDLAMSAVTDVLATQKVHWANVGRSFVPYRSW